MKIYLLPFALITALSAGAVDITVGDDHTLVDALNDVDSATTHLTISGKMAADQLTLLREKLPALTSLDLSGLTLSPSAIPEYAFAGTSISEFKSPIGLETVGESAFSATPLVEFSAPSTLTGIGRYAFAHCHSLATVTPGSGLVSVGDFALSDCPALKNFEVGATLVTIGECAFQATGQESIDLTGCTALDYVGDYAFADNQALTTLALPGHGLTLGSGVVAFCPSLKSVSGLEGVTTLSTLFAADSPNVKLDFGSMESLETILSHALYGVSAPRGVVLPASLNHLGSHAMESMTGLVEINASALTTVPTVDDDVWLGLDKSKITLVVAVGMEDSLRAAPQWSEFNISTTSGLTAVEADASALTITVDHGIVTARSTTGTAVVSLSVYLADGRIAAIVGGNATGELTADVRSLAGQAVIAVAIDSEGHRSTLSTIVTR